LKTSYGGRRLAENVTIPSYGEGSKIAQKKNFMNYERSLTAHSFVNVEISAPLNLYG